MHDQIIAGLLESQRVLANFAAIPHHREIQRWVRRDYWRGAQLAGPQYRACHGQPA